MGYYILAPDVALRSWEGTPYTAVRRFADMPLRLSPEDFHTALACDGMTELPVSPELIRLEEIRIIQPCGKGERSLSPWQRHRRYPCRVMPWLSLEITGRCNYNCLHCFNAADNARLTSELSPEQYGRVLDDAAAAGIQAVLITGGEPLVHPRFADIVKAVYSRDMFVHELNTNGRLLTSGVLDLFRSLGYLPEIKISFDGLGFHDWMRDHVGAEQETLAAIRLCVEEHVPVRVQVNANRRNKESIRPTLRFLSKMGVPRIRVICTTATPRWAENAPDASFTWDEYLEFALDEASSYAGDDCEAELDFWQIITMKPAIGSYRFHRVLYNSEDYRSTRPICMTMNGMPAVGADGELFPCMQCQGTQNAYGISLGNVLQDGLLPLMQGGRYCDIAHATVYKRLLQNSKCLFCKWYIWCVGGCPALGFLHSKGDYLAHDPTACTFFEGGWVERFEQALPGWTSETPLT